MRYFSLHHFTDGGPWVSVRLSDFPKVTMRDRIRPAGSVIFLLSHFQESHKERKGNHSSAQSSTQLVPGATWTTTCLWKCGGLSLKKAETGFTQHGWRAGPRLCLCLDPHSCSAASGPCASLWLPPLLWQVAFQLHIPCLCGKAPSGHQSPVALAYGRLAGLGT